MHVDKGPQHTVHGAGSAIAVYNVAGAVSHPRGSQGPFVFRPKTQFTTPPRPRWLAGTPPPRAHTPALVAALPCKCPSRYRAMPGQQGWRERHSRLCHTVNSAVYQHKVPHQQAPPVPPFSSLTRNMAHMTATPQPACPASTLRYARRPKLRGYALSQPCPSLVPAVRTRTPALQSTPRPAPRTCTYDTAGPPGCDYQRCRMYPVRGRQQSPQRAPFMPQLTRQPP